MRELVDLSVQGFTIREHRLGVRGEEHSLFDLFIPGTTQVLKLTSEQFQDLRVFCAVLLSAQKLLRGE